jgi:hypothetical protein
MPEPTPLRKLCADCREATRLSVRKRVCPVSQMLMELEQVCAYETEDLVRLRNQAQRRAETLDRMIQERDGGRSA